MQMSNLPHRETMRPLPPQVQRLAAREREVASIVYAAGAATANDVQKHLSAEISNGAVRSMLVRLVGKGILARRWGKRGRGQKFVYAPAVTDDDLKQDAIKRLTFEFFDGSLVDVAKAVTDLLGRTSDAATQRITHRPF